MMFFPKSALGFAPPKIVASLDLTETYEDNILLPDGGKGQNLVTTARPALSLTLPMKRSEAKFLGSLMYVYSSKYQEYRARYTAQQDLRTLSYNILGALSLFFLKDLLFSFQSEYSAVPIYLFQPGEAPANLAQRSQQKGGVVFQHAFSSRTSARASYDGAIAYYSTPVTGTSTSHEASLGFRWKPGKPLSVFLEYSYLVHILNRNGRSQIGIHQPRMGLLSEMRDVDGEASFGYQQIERKGAGFFPTGGYIIILRGTYGEKKTVKAAIDALRRTTVDFVGNAYEETGGGLSVAWRLGTRVELTAEGRGGQQKFDLPVVTQRYFQTGGGGSVRVTKRLSASLGYTHFENTGDSGRYSNNLYNVTVRAAL